MTILIRKGLLKTLALAILSLPLLSGGVNEPSL